MGRREFLIGAAATFALPYIQRAKADEAFDILYTSSENLDLNLLAHKSIKLALSKINKPYRLVPTVVPYPTQSGAMNALKNGAIDVGWFGAETVLADVSDPVLFPMDRGLFGYRVFLINRKAQTRFSAVNSIEDLRHFTALQGEGWTDVKILAHAGIPVSTGLPQNLYRMVAGGRGDFFPRGASEAVRELRIHEKTVPELALEETLLLKYRFGLMFFVNRKRKQLHEDLSRALQAAFDDGSFEDMFMADATIKSALTEINIGGRRKIEIENPSLFPAFLAIDSKYWINI